jgi:hypothetical protein
MLAGILKDKEKLILSKWLMLGKSFGRLCLGGSTCFGII